MTLHFFGPYFFTSSSTFLSSSSVHGPLLAPAFSAPPLAAPRSFE